MTNPQVITDPALAASFDAAAAAQTPVPAAGPAVITDPQLAASFDAAAKPHSSGALSTAGGYAGALASGFNEGLGRAAGVPVDLANLLGAGLREGPARALETAGASDAGAWWRKNLFPPMTMGTGQANVDAIRQAGFSQPTGGPIQQAAKDLASGVTSGALTGLMAPGAGLGGAISGAGGALGAEAATKANDTLGQPVPAPLADIIGAIFGGKTAARVGNRTINYTPTAEMQEMRAAGVTPRLASDVDATAGAPGGTRSVAAASGQATKDEIGAFANRSIPNTGQTLQEQGTNLQQVVERQISRLKDDTNAAYDDLRKTVPATTPIDLTNTKSAIQNITDRAQGDPDLERFISNPTLQRLLPFLNKSALTFEQMNVFRQEVGQSLHSPTLTGPEQGLLRQVYGAVQTDLEHSLSADPTAMEKLNKANQLWQHNTALIGDLQTSVLEKTPENLPGWATREASKGGTRLGTLADTMTPEQSAMLLRNAGSKDGQIDLDRVMKFYKEASPEAQAALTRDPATAQAMAALERMYDATTRSRSLARTADSGGVNALDLGNKVSGFGQIAHGVATLDPIKTGLGMAQLAAGPLISKGGELATRAWQGGGMAARMNSPLAGGMLDPTTAGRYGVLGGTSQMFPDVYQPKPATPQPPSGGQVQSWLGSTDRQTGTAYIASRLGPAVAQQLGQTDANGYRAALFSLFARPEYRQALAVNNSTEGNSND